MAMPLVTSRLSRGSSISSPRLALADRPKRRFCDFAQAECGLEGEKKPISDVFNVEIEVTGYKLGKSCVKDKDLLQLQYVLDGRVFVSFTNSAVLIRQIQQYEKEIPFLTTIVKRNSYYTFS